MNGFRNLNIGFKIMTGYLVVLALMTVIGGISLARLGSLNDSVQNLTGSLADDLKAANGVEVQIVLVRLDANKYLRAESENDLSACRQEKAALNKVLAEAEAAITNPERVAMLARIKTSNTDCG